MKTWKIKKDIVIWEIVLEFKWNEILVWEIALCSHYKIRTKIIQSSIMLCFFYVLLTVHRVTTLGKWPTWCTIMLYNAFIVIILYVFRTTLCSSAGGQIVFTFWRRNYFFLILAHPVYEMWILKEQNTLKLWNKLHFEEKRRRLYTMFKIFSAYIF